MTALELLTGSRVQYTGRKTDAEHLQMTTLIPQRADTKTPMLARSPGLAEMRAAIKSPLVALFVLILWVCASISSPTLAASETAASIDDAPSETIMVLGDSIGAAYGLPEAAGWVQLLHDELTSTHPQVQVINTSISGDTTDGGLQRLPAALDRFKPTIVLIELGGNDGLRGQSLKRMQQNLNTMVNLIMERGAAPVLVGMRIPPNYGTVYAERFHATYADVANATGAALVPFLLEPIAEDRSYFQSDGIHPSELAQPLLMNEVLPVVKSLITTP